MPLRMQMEQLQRRPDVISSLSKRKRTAPQWQLPQYVFVDAERRWARGTFKVSTAGDAFIDVERRMVPFEAALASGLRRVLN